MKVILTGATGFVGAATLARLVAHPDVSEVTCLTRRPLAEPVPKVTAIVREDFLRYDEALVEHLRDHESCIWTLGGKASDLGTEEEFTRVTHAFTLALAEQMTQHAEGRFTFCYLSGMGADPSETAWWPWEKLTRHIKGRTERDLSALQESHPGFSVHSFRPGGILPEDAQPWLRAALGPIVVGVDELADALIYAALEPQLFRQWSVVGNADIKRFAKRDV